MIFNSTVKGHEGPCVPVWVNGNRVCNRLDGGTTGFFRRVKVWLGVTICKVGPEFHGIVKTGNTVETTERPHE